MKKYISLILISIMLVSSCLAVKAEGTVSFVWQEGRIYSDLASLETSYTGSLKEMTFKLDGEIIGVSETGSLELEPGTLSVGNHIIEAVALYDDNTAASARENINVYKSYAPQKSDLTLGSKWNGVATVTEVSGKFGKSSDDKSYKVAFSGGQQQQILSLPSSKTITCQYGDVIKLTTSIGADAASDFVNEPQLSFSLEGKYEGTGSTGNNLTSNYQSCYRFNFATGAMSLESWEPYIELPSSYERIACSAGEWNNYEFYWTVGRGVQGDEDYVSNKLSIYKNGKTIVKDHNFEAKTPSGYNAGALKTITGIALFEKGKNKTLYFDDISLSHYRADYGAEQISYLKEGSWTTFTNELVSDAEKLKLKLSKALDKSTFTTSNISLVSDMGTKTISSIETTSDASEVIISVAEGFSKGENLKLILSENIKSSVAVTVDESLCMRFKTEAAPLTPDNLSFKKGAGTLISPSQLVNGDSVTVEFTLDIPPEEEGGVAAYLCIRQNNRLCAIKPVHITSSGAQSAEILALSGLEGSSNIEVKLIICDDFVTTKPYNMIKLS